MLFKKIKLKVESEVIFTLAIFTFKRERKFRARNLLWPLVGQFRSKKAGSPQNQFGWVVVIIAEKCTIFFKAYLLFQQICSDWQSYRSITKLCIINESSFGEQNGIPSHVLRPLLTWCWICFAVSALHTKKHSRQMRAVLHHSNNQLLSEHSPIEKLNFKVRATPGQFRGYCFGFGRDFNDQF